MYFFLAIQLDGYHQEAARVVSRPQEVGPARLQLVAERVEGRKGGHPHSNFYLAQEATGLDYKAMIIMIQVRVF